jgi:hypothetical protein
MTRGFACAIVRQRQWAARQGDRRRGRIERRSDAMSGVLVLAVIGLWGLIGRWVWKNFVAPRVPAARTRLAGVAFALAWFVVPVGDEILGAIEFRRLCEAIPPTVFHGPIAMGPGAFFDEQGNRKWRSEEEFSAIRRDSEEWRRIWDSTSERVNMVRWPMEIIQIRNAYMERATGRVVIESYFRGSGGGWLNEALRGDIISGYSCQSKGAWPRDQDTIVFDPNAARTGGVSR